jgi:hypothetical protein
MRCYLCLSKGGKHIPCRVCGKVAGALPPSVAPERAIPALEPGTLTPVVGEETAAGLGTIRRVGLPGRSKMEGRTRG